MPEFINLSFCTLTDVSRAQFGLFLLEDLCMIPPGESNPDWSSCLLPANREREKRLRTHEVKSSGFTETPEDI